MKTKCPACKCSLDVICDFYAILKAFRDEAEIHGRIDIMPTLEKLHDKVTLEKALCKDAKTSTLVDKCKPLPPIEKLDEEYGLCSKLPPPKIVLVRKINEIITRLNGEE